MNHDTALSRTADLTPIHTFGTAVHAPSPSSLAEPSVTVCRPIVPLGDVARVRTAASGPVTTRLGEPFRFVKIGGDLHWCLSTDDWHLTSPILPTGGNGRAASSEAVLDVYIGLLLEFAQRGLPADNTVRFSPGPFTRALGWCAGSARGTPTGRQYRQLDLALDYLRHANIESEAVRAQLEAIYGVRLLRSNFGVLQSWSKAAVESGVGGAVEVEARFSDFFAALLRHDHGAVRYCGTLYAALPRGVARPLFRYIEGLRAGATSPSVTVLASSVLAHIGCRRRGLEPSRMKAILDEPHNVLLANRVLGDLPRWSESRTGEWQLTYLLDSTPELGLLLEETAAAFGVSRALSKDWAANRLDRFTEVLAAAIQGILTPTGTLGTMVHHYMERKSVLIDAGALPHFEEGQGLLLPERRSPEFGFLQQQYAATRAWLTERPEVEKPLRRQFATEARPNWVIDGLVLIAARGMRGAENLDAWKRRVYGVRCPAGR